MDFNDVYQFWFKECDSADWWQKSDAFDSKIKQRFEKTLLKAVAGELHHWRSSAIGSLCEIIVLDQFSRNIYRDTPLAFSHDPQALALAQFAIDKEFDKQLSESERSFLYMPFMHSESLVIHQQADALFKSLANYQFELAHKAIIEQFGRYPHRNDILGRESTAEELRFLQQPNSSF